MQLTRPRGITSNKLLLALALSFLVHVVVLTPLMPPIVTPTRVAPSITITLTQPKALTQANLSTQTPVPVKKIITTTEDSTPIKQPLNAAPQKNNVRHPLTPAPKTVSKHPTLKKPSKNLSVKTLVQQISDMGRTISNQAINPKNSRIKFSNSLSQSHQYKATYYIKQWQAKVERIGNLNYPAIAQTPGFRGTLRIDAGINPDGSLYSIRVRQSSGNKALDEAAMNIVRMGVPYSPLPKELLDEIDVLVISRVWQFSDETGISTSQ
ncbi:MAG TPA: energy transducer TonB [Methylococcales bacterium]|jgi:protein TonB|nr:energy transducer TonB [Methylococcales bacterium]